MNEQRARIPSNGVLMMAIAAVLGVSITLNGFLLRDAYQNLRADVNANSANIKRASEALAEVEQRLDKRVTDLETRHKISDRLDAAEKR